MSYGQIRIISGQWRHRKLPVLNSTGLRPTSNRAREMLFDWLIYYIADAKCLDCFAGSGALGFEALSRYANYVILLEIESHVAKQLQQTVNMLKANAKVINTDTLTFLSKPGIPHDIVFVDPPFNKKLISNTLMLLEKNGWLTNNAFIYIESESKNKSLLIPKKWNLYRKKISKQVAYYLYHRVY